MRYSFIFVIAAVCIASGVCIHIGEQLYVYIGEQLRLYWLRGAPAYVLLL
jgi:hypothetical protein